MSNVSILEKDFIQKVFDLEMDIILQNDMIDLLEKEYEKSLTIAISIDIPKHDAYEISLEAMNDIHKMIENVENEPVDGKNRQWFTNQNQFDSIIGKYQNLEEAAKKYREKAKRDNYITHKQAVNMMYNNQQVLGIHTQDLIVLWKQLNKVHQTLTETKEVLRQYYDNTDFLPNKKYHNIIVLSKMCEYFNDHRAATIGEALNIYNNEVQHQNIEDKLNNISLRLDQQFQGVIENQNVLYAAIQRGNQIMTTISDEMHHQLSEMEKIKDRTMQMDNSIQNLDWKLNAGIESNRRLMKECQRISDRNHQYTHELLDKYQKGQYHGQ